MNSKIKKIRLPVELKQLQKNSSEHGITCAFADSNDNSSHLIANIPGPKGSPYEDGIFKVSIVLGSQYPFQPPTFKFMSSIYHPNIDNSGKICLDLLRMPPTGSYNPAITLESMLLSIQLLLSSPNPDDPLNGEAADLFKTSREQFNIKARELIPKNCLNAEESDKETATDTTQDVSNKCDDTVVGPASKRNKPC
ncbi:ubiquitin-conjugating enzyme E2 2-like [Rhagoletis pomonella]|uniref:ubiquitin-conjugating enzyme E2 2-like n=1 Tax=Rhagoletis pomonella TaxID=28610 RepID=UPI00178729C3|nr:ubiquitin-conjugating enzyme E2 2-like [Rhagoletis pomonella]